MGRLAGHPSADNTDTWITPSSAASLARRWAVPVGTDTPLPPIVVGGTLYVPDQNGVTALDASRGTVRWHTSVGVGNSHLAYADGVIYNTTQGRRGAWLNALQASGGTRLFSVKLNTGRPKSPVVSNGVVYVSVSGGLPASELQARSAKTGALLWRRAFQGDEASSPAVGGNQLVVMSKAGAVANGINASSGALLWSRTVASSNTYGFEGFRPTLDKGTLYAQTAGGGIVALNAGTGALRWRASLEASARGVAIDGTRLLTWVDNDKRLVCLDAGTGRLLWDWSLALDHYGSIWVAVAGGVVFAGDYPEASFPAGRLVALNELNGAELGEVKDVGWFIGPSISRGRIYVTTDGLLTATAVPGAP